MLCWAALAAPCRRTCAEGAQEHVGKVVAQLLSAEGVEAPERWLPIVCALATEAAELLSPALMSATLPNVFDPRRFVKVMNDPPPAVVSARLRMPSTLPCLDDHQQHWSGHCRHEGQWCFPAKEPSG